MEDVDVADGRGGRATIGQDAVGLILLVGIVLLLYLALAWVWDRIFGGGVFSLFDAIRGSRNGAATIELDRDALTMPMLVPVGLGAIGIGWKGEPIFRKLGFETGGKLQWMGTTLGVIAFFLVVGFSSMLSERLVGWVMTSRHYSRCAALDHHTGSGKSAVHYDMFVLHPADCRPA